MVELRFVVLRCGNDGNEDEGAFGVGGRGTGLSD